MKTLYLLLSNLASLFLGYTFIINLKYSFEFGYIIFMSLLAILFLIFIVLTIMSFQKKPRSKSLFYNSYSDKRVKNEEFDRNYSFMNQ